MSRPTGAGAVPAVALAVGAHPDDVEFGCGATLAAWAAGGCRVHHLVCTDGSKGSWDPAQDRAALVATRQAEQRAAAAALGATGDVTFMGWVDGELESGLHHRGEIARHIRRIRPDVVLGHDPWKRYRLHPDHRHAGFLVTDGIVAARDPHFFPEQGLAPHRPSALYLWEADEPDHVEDVTGHEETKIRAILAHRSQFVTTMAITDPAHAGQVTGFRQRIIGRLAETGTPAGYRSGEAFRRITQL